MATKNLNTSPYYDDHSSSGNYHRILFKPSFAIQARELTQSQSILQDQVKRIADVQNGDAVVPGVLTYTNNVGYITLENVLDTTEIIGTGDATKTNIIGKYIGNFGNTVKAKIIAGVDRSTSLSDNFVNGSAIQSATDITLFVSYLRADLTTLSSPVNTFSDDELVYELSSGIAPVDPADSWNRVGRGVGNSSIPVTGLGSAIMVSSGIYYVNGFAVNVPEQQLILDKYDTTPSYRIGFNFTETFVNAVDDNTLYDNAVGSSNFSAPGADRYKIELVLAKKSLTSTSNEKFIEIVRVVDGVIQEKNTSQVVVNPDDYSFEVREDLSTEYDVNGIAGVSTTGSRDKFVLGIESGKSKTFLSLDKSRTVKDAISNFSTPANSLGGYILTSDGFAEEVRLRVDWNNKSGVTESNILVGDTVYQTGSNTDVGASGYTAVSASGEVVSVDVGAAATNYIVVKNVKGIFDSDKLFHGTNWIEVRDDAGNITTPITVTSDGFFDFTKGLYPIHLVSDGSSIGTARVWNVEKDSGGEFRIYIFDVAMGAGVFSTIDSLYEYDLSDGSLGDRICDVDTYVGGVDKFGVDTTGSTTVRSTKSSSLLFELPKSLAKLDSTVNSFYPPAISKTRISGVVTATLSGSASQIVLAVGSNLTLDNSLNDETLIYGYDEVHNRERIIDNGGLAMSGSGGNLTIQDASATSIKVGEEYAIIASAKLPSGSGATPTSSVATKSCINTSDQITTKALVQGATIYLTNSDILPNNYKVYMSDEFDINATSTVSTTNHDVTSWFTLDTGQRDAYYKRGSIRLKSEYSAENLTGQLLVCYYYLSHGSSGNYYTVDSYPVGQTPTVVTHSFVSNYDGGAVFKFEDIPSYIDDSGREVRLSNVVDCRSTKAHALANVGSEIATDFTYAGSRRRTIPVDANITMEPNEYYPVKYFPSRIDSAYVNSEGVVKSVSGIPSEEPEAPEVPLDGTPLYNIEVLPYTYDLDDVIVTDVDEDKERIDDLEYLNDVVGLKNDAYVHDLGYGRTKRDVFVDPFIGHNFGNSLDPEYSVSVDRKNNELRPSFGVTSLDMEVGSDIEIATTGGLVSISKDVDTPDVVEVQNTESNTDQSLRSSDVTTYNGYLKVSPGYDNWKSVESKPILKRNKNGALNTIKKVTKSSPSIYRELSDSLKSQGTIWNDWKENWAGNDSDYTPIIRRETSGSSTELTFTASGLKPHSRIETIKFNGETIHDAAAGTTSIEVDTSTYGTTPYFQTDSNGEFVGMFDLQNKDENTSESLKFPTGRIRVTLEGDQSYAEGYYVASGDVKSHNTDLTRPLEYSWDAQTDESISQVFEIFDDCFASKLDLYFSTNDLYTRQIIVQIREVDNGKPTNRVLITEVLKSSQLTATATAGVQSITLSSLVYLARGKYCITVITPSIEYTASALNVDENSGSKPIGVHGLFLGTSEVKNRILKFTLYRAKFKTGVTSSCAFKTVSLPNRYLPDNPIETTAGSSAITVIDPDHGYVGQETIKLKGFRGRNEPFLDFANFSASFAVGDDVWQGGYADDGIPHGRIVSVDNSGGVETMTIASLSGKFVASTSVYGTGGTPEASNPAAPTYAKHVQGVPLDDIADVEYTVQSSNLTNDSYQIIKSSGTALPQLTGSPVGDSGDAGSLGSPVVEDNVYVVNGAVKADVIYHAVNSIIPDGTGVTWEMSTDNQVTYTDTEINSDVEMDSPVRINSSQPYYLTGIFSTNSDRISPVIDLSGISTIAISNRIDSVTARISDATPSSDVITGHKSAYLSDRVKLNDSANSVKVVFDAIIPEYSDLDIAIKCRNAESSTTHNFDDSDWQVLSSVGTLKKSNDTFTECIYLLEDITDFSLYTIRIVMRSTNSTQVPRIKNLKVIPYYYDRSDLPVQAMTFAHTQANVTDTSYGSVSGVGVNDIFKVDTGFKVDNGTVIVTNGRGGKFKSGAVHSDANGRLTEDGAGYDSPSTATTTSVVNPLSNNVVSTGGSGLTVTYAGTGSLTSVTVVDPGSGYNVGDRVRINPVDGGNTPSTHAYMDITSEYLIDGEVEIYKTSGVPVASNPDGTGCYLRFKNPSYTTTGEEINIDTLVTLFGRKV